MTSLTVEPIYGSLPLAILASALTLAVILLVTPPTDSPFQRRWLIALRLTASIVLLLALWRPSVVQTDNRPADAVLVVAVDQSKSMTLPDGHGSDRWSVQTDAWRKLATGLVGVDEALAVRLIGYDRTSRSIDASVSALDDLRPDGALTDLATAGLAAIEAAEGQPITGIILMGDGTQTAPLRGTGVGRVAETFNSLGVPLWTVPIGPAGGQTAARDVAIDSLDESLQLFAGNDANVSFQVLSRGLVGVTVPVSLTWIASDGTTSEVAVRQVTATKSSDAIPLSIQVTAPAPGSYRLRVDVKPQDGELVTTNNVQTAFVDVREGGGRILYLEGSLRNEQVFLRRSLRRFQDLDLEFRTILSDTSRRWPVDLNDALEPGKFDIYIIGDLDADALGNQQLAALAESVSAGAGLITLGGFQTYGAGGYATSPLADVIPIKMDRSRRQSIDAATTGRDDQFYDSISIDLARRHPITDLGGADPAQTWRELPPMVGANRFVGPKIAPGVDVLLQTSDGEPLLVVGQYGRGRTAAVAFDSTWRWWRGGDSDAHRRFWRQLMLWLLSREESGDKIAIEMDARRFAVDDSPQFRASVQSISNQPENVQLVAELISESNEATAIEVTTEGDGRAIRGAMPTVKPGFYRLRVRTAVESTSLQAEELAFQVVDRSREMANPMADPVFLQQLASITADHGGAAFAPEEIDNLIQTIKQRRVAAETPIVEKQRLGDGPLSGWILFTLFAGTLSTEWFLRRRWGLA